MEVLNEHLSLLVGRYVPTKVIRVHNKDKPWFDDQCRRAFDLKQEAHFQWTRDHSRIHWEEFLRCQVRANKTYSEARRQFCVKNRDVLMNAQSTSSSVANYQPISITSVLSKVFERLGSVRLGRFIERSGVLPTT